MHRYQSAWCDGFRTRLISPHPVIVPGRAGERIPISSRTVCSSKVIMIRSMRCSHGRSRRVVRARYNRRGRTSYGVGVVPPSPGMNLVMRLLRLMTRRATRSGPLSSRLGPLSGRLRTALGIAMVWSIMKLTPLDFAASIVV